MPLHGKSRGCETLTGHGTRAAKLSSQPFFTSCTVEMNNTFPEFSIARPCVVPFTVSDFVYNPRCHSQAFLNHLGYLFSIYIECMRFFYSTAFIFLSEQWINIAAGITISSILFFLVKLIFFEDPDEPLTPLESEIMQHIHANASTGCTTLMLYEYLDYLDGLSIDTLTKTLKNLKRRQMLLPVQATLWVAAGK